MNINKIITLLSCIDMKNIMNRCEHEIGVALEAMEYYTVYNIPYLYLIAEQSHREYLQTYNKCTNTLKVPEMQYTLDELELQLDQELS